MSEISEVIEKLRENAFFINEEYLKRNVLLITHEKVDLSDSNKINIWRIYLINGVRITVSDSTSTGVSVEVSR